mmetsp:Transcript_34837/g.81369  ORF Transcript_34837/g.81369 Transcript_34837/m.81369 type:complete len:175 (-) Transcript_34837:49-573(-)
MSCIVQAILDVCKEEAKEQAKDMIMDEDDGMLRMVCDNVFDKHDTDQDGYLKQSDVDRALSEVLARMGLPMPRGPYAARITMGAFDDDDDGEIDKDDFYKVVKEVVKEAKGNAPTPMQRGVDPSRIAAQPQSLRVLPGQQPMLLVNPIAQPFPAVAGQPGPALMMQPAGLIRVP